MATDGNYGFEDIGYPLAPGRDAELAVDWEWLYGSLETRAITVLLKIYWTFVLREIVI